MQLSGKAARREFEAFTAACTDELIRTGFLMVDDLSEAKDLVQETLIRVARRWHRVRTMDRPVAYARRILVNLVIDGAPDRSRRIRELSRPSGEAVPFDVFDRAATETLGTSETRVDLIEALMSLSPRQRAVLVLRYWVDLPESEVARIMNCSVGTIKSTASRSLVQLREQITSQADPATDRCPEPSSPMRGSRP